MKKKKFLSVFLAFAMIVSLMPRLVLPARAATYTLSGTVSAGSTGASVSGITVTLYADGSSTYSGETDSNGVYSIADVPDGRYAAAVAADTVSNSYAQAATFVTVSGGGATANITLAAPTNTWQDHFSLAEPYYDSSASTYTVNSAVQLAWVAYMVNSGQSDFSGQTIQLGNSINLANTYNWMPIGNSNSTIFKGTFDGKGNIITALTVNSSNLIEYGLFGITQNATIKNVGVDGTITADYQYQSYVGLLIGMAEHTNISRCFSTGLITSKGNYGSVGGLVGYVNDSDMNNTYTMEDCYSNAIVQLNANGNAGGLVGKAQGYSASTTILNNCYATGDTTSSDSTGGLIGCLANCALSNSYASGRVTGSTACGGLIGIITVQTASNAYWDKTVNSSISGVGDGPDASYAFTTAQMTVSDFAMALNAGQPPAPWVWISGVNNNYPVLNGVGDGIIPSFSVSGTVSAGSTGLTALSGITVNLYDSRDTAYATVLYTGATTTSGGAFSIPNVANGSYVAVVPAASGSYKQSASSTFIVSGGDVASGANITLQPKGEGADYSVSKDANGKFIVNGGATTYDNLAAALVACAGSNPLIQLGNSSSDPLILPKSDYTKDDNKLKTATYTGWVTLTDSGTYYCGLVIPTGVSADFSALAVSNASGATTPTYAVYLTGGSLDVLTGTSITVSTYNSTKPSSGIYNDGSGTVSMSDGTIASAQRCIESHAGTLNISGGSLTTDATTNAEECILGTGSTTTNISGSAVITSAGTSGSSSAVSSTQTLNISGGTISGYVFAVTNMGTLTMTAGLVKGTGASSTAFLNQAVGNATISGGSIEQKVSGTGSGCAISNYGALILNGTASICASGSPYCTAINNASNGTVTIGDNVAISSNFAAIDNASTSTNSVVITGGTITAGSESSSDCNGVGLGNTSSGTVAISGGTFNICGYSRCNAITNVSGTINISGGTLTATATKINSVPSSIYNGSGTVNISSGTIKSYISNTSSTATFQCLTNDTGTVNITGGTLTAATESANSIAQAVVNSSTGTINISGGTITSNGTMAGSCAAGYINLTSYGPIVISKLSGSDSPVLRSASDSTILLPEYITDDGAHVTLFGTTIYSNSKAAAKITGTYSSANGNYEIDSTNYSGATLSASDLTDGYGLLAWTNDSGRGVSSYLSTQSTVTLGTLGSTSIYLCIVLAPGSTATGGSFIDTDGKAGEIAGTISWTAPTGTDFTGYKVYWGSNTSTILSTSPSAICSLSGTSSTTATVADNTAIPTGANYLLVYCTNGSLMASSCLFIAIDDLIGVTLSSGSLGTAGNGKVSELTNGTKYTVTSGSTTYYVKANGTLSTSESDVAGLSGTEITGLANGTTYNVQVYIPTKVNLAAGSQGTAGDGKITGLTTGTKYIVISGSTVYYVKADGTLSASASDAAALAGTEITGLTNGTTYKAEEYYTSVILASGSQGTAGDGKITGLASGTKYKVSVGSTTYFVKADGTLSGSSSDAAALTGTEITGLTNGTTYKAEEYYTSVILASGSQGTAGDGIITGLASGTKYKVTSGSTVYYAKADGTLSTSAADAAALTGTVITGLINGTTYEVEGYYTSVILSGGSLGTAGDGKITGLTSGTRYKVTSGSAVYYVKADGTLSANAADAAALTGIEITGLTNGTTYNAQAYYTSVILSGGSLGTAGDGIITGLTSGTRYKVTVGSTTYYVKADGTLSPNSSDAAALAGTEINGLANGEIYDVEAYRVTLATSSLGTADDGRITGLIPGTRYVVTVDGTTGFVTAGGTLSINYSSLGGLTGTEITGLNNDNTYLVEVYSPKVILYSGSLGIAGDGCVTSLPNKQFAVLVGNTNANFHTGAVAVYYVMANGALSANPADIGTFAGGTISGLTNNKIYMVADYQSTASLLINRIYLSMDSLGSIASPFTAISGMTPGTKYKITMGSTVYYTKADGTVTTDASQAAALNGTEITGLALGCTYKAEAYSTSVSLSSGSLGTAGDGKITGLTPGTMFKVTSGSTVYYVKADGTLSTSSSDVAALTGTEITGLINGTAYYVEVYTSGGSSGGSSGYSGSTGSSTSSGSASVVVDGKTQNAGTATTATQDGKTTTTVTISTDKLKSILDSSGSGATVTIPITTGSNNASGKLNGQAVKDMENNDATLVIKTDSESYSLPASEIDIDSVSGKFGTSVSLSDITVNVSIAEPSDATAKVVENAASAGGYTIAVPAVEFTVSCSYGGKTVEVSSFNSYVQRLIAIPSGVDASKITTAVVVEADGTVHHVPTEVTVIDGKYYAKINSLTNSVYSLIYNPITFSDIANHWAKDAINDMGSRLVVSGVGNNNYDPDRSITRAEFAAIMVRALGLEPGTGTNGFNDVKSTDWFCGYIETASTYGIIKGYDSSAFGPSDTITREQAMAMIARAMKITGLKASLTDSDVSSLLVAYTDASSASDYAKDSIAACLKTGIVSGTSANTIAPKDCVTRAEVAVIAERLLQQSGLI